MMTIKELEEAVGMTRANIRFYEQEGLLSPARSANGYRDYSPEDAAALEKIKLLRRLHLDLNTLRRLQAGELTLAEALEKQLGQLGRDQSALDRARAVCAQLRAAGTEYQQLDAHPWLEELDRAPASERFAPPADELPPAPGHPWRRYFARMLDLALYGLPITAVEVLVLHLSPNLTSKAFIALLEGYLGFALMFLLEPLLLHYWGTTPGKLLFGIVLRDADGSPLSLSDARKRLSLLFSRGLGWGIPIYNLYRLYKSASLCSEGERNPWEWNASDGRAQRMDIPENTWRCFAFAGAQAACLAVVVLITLQGQLPPHRGELNEAKFYDNYNFYLRYFDLDARPLGPDGRPSAAEDGTGGFSMELFPSHSSQWTPLLTAGTVTGFQYRSEFTGSFFPLSCLNTPQSLGLLAYAGTLPGINCLNFKPKQWLDQISGEDWNYDVTYRGLRMTQSARFANVENQSGAFVTAPDGQEGRLLLTFTVQAA